MKQSRLSRFVKFAPLATISFLIAGCAPSYSPNTYASNAVQVANKVEPGTVVGYREVAISSNGTVGTVAGGAAGGLLAAEYTDSPLAALGGTTVGAMVGNTLDHVAKDTTGWEYIVRQRNGDMVSVTQRERKPLTLGQQVLVIMGPQARVVPDYSVAQEQPAKPDPAKAKTDDKPPETPVKVELVLSLPPGVSAQSISGAAIVAQPPPALGTVKLVTEAAPALVSLVAPGPIAVAEPAPEAQSAAAAPEAAPSTPAPHEPDAEKPADAPTADGN